MELNDTQSEMLDHEKKPFFYESYSYRINQFLIVSLRHIVLLLKKAFEKFCIEQSCPLYSCSNVIHEKKISEIDL